MNELANALELSMKDDMAALLALAKKRTDKVALVYPGFFPLELLEAGGFWHVTFWHHFQTARADAHLAPFACTFSKAFLSFALDNRKYFDAIALSNICDTTQNLYALMKKIFTEKTVLWLHLPQNPTSLSAKEYISAQVKKIWQQIAGDKRPAALKEAIRTRNVARSKLSELNKYRAQGLLKYSAWERALFSYFSLPASSAIPLLDGIVEEAKKNLPSQDRVRLFALGKLIVPVDTPEFLESIGAAIVGDSMLLGARAQLAGIPQSDDPLDALANSLSALPASPYHHTEPYDYAENVSKNASELKADGTIIFRLKYCDPEAFDYPELKGALEKAKIPTLMLEVEMTKKLSGHEKTRVEAFVESLKGNR